jgi:GGDEF domain-containing protein
LGYQPLADGGWVDIQEDITEKRRTEEKIQWLAHHDPLTGVANRFTSVRLSSRL